jgi:hypothetical protein
MTYPQMINLLKLYPMVETASELPGQLALAVLPQ